MPPLALAILVALLWANPAYAYVGPGMGLAVIGAIIGGITTVILAFFGLLWYPIKKRLRRPR